MPPSTAPNPQDDAGRLEAAADQAIEACGGDARGAVKALIVANEFLEAQVEELQADVSKGYARGYHHGRFKTYTG
ncbi:MAG TPA: hypothetical protein VK603_16660 [Candidatus Saccharimonadales bacterium]|nr:hypothetical protein [Candidatus Saccharimonadales bacterium]